MTSVVSVPRFLDSQPSRRPNLTLLLVLVVGCATPPPASTPAADTTPAAIDLKGTSWRLVDLAGAAPLENVEATLEFPEAGKTSGRASCNRFFGTVEMTGQSIKFGPLGATKMSCGAATDAQERKYLDALQAAERFALDGPELHVYSAGLPKPLRLVRK